MTKPYRAIALVSLLLSLRVCVAADSPATEAWHVYVDKQVPYGSEHVVKRSLANGDVEYRVEIVSNPFQRGVSLLQVPRQTLPIRSDGCRHPYR